MLVYLETSREEREDTHETLAISGKCTMQMLGCRVPTRDSGQLGGQPQQPRPRHHRRSRTVDAAAPPHYRFPTGGTSEWIC